MKRNKLNSKNITKATSKIAAVLTLASATFFGSAIFQMTSADVVAHAADEDSNAIEYKLSEEETQEILENTNELFPQEKGSIFSNFNDTKKQQSENAEMPNEVEVENGDIAEDLNPEIKDMVDEANKNLDENKNGNILNPDETNPEVNPNNPNSGTIDDATSNLPDSKELKNDQVTNKGIKHGLIGGGILALISLIGAVIGISVARGAKRSTKKENDSLFK